MRKRLAFNFISNSTWFWIILALLFRLPSLNQSLWLDEAIQASSTKLSLSQLLFSYMTGDFNPPLYHLLTWILARIVGTGEIVLRLPSLMAGIGIVLLGRRFLKDILIENQLLINLGSLLLASAPLLIYYSQEARPYEIAACFVVWSMVSFYETLILEKNRRWEYWIVTIILFFTHYLAWFIWPIQCLIALIIDSKLKTKTVIKLLSLPLLGILLLLPILIPQLVVGSGAAGNLPVWRSLSTFSFKQLVLIPVKILIGRLPVENSVAFGFILGIPLLVWGSVWITAVKRNSDSLRKLIYLNRDWIFLSFWLFLPVAIGALISVKLAVFTYFRFLYIAPAFYLLLIMALKGMSKNKQILIVAIFILINGLSSGLYLFDSRYHREDWRSLVSYINQNEASAAVMVLKPVAAPFQYYDQGNNKVVDYNDLEAVKYDRELWLIKYAQPIFEPDNHTEEQLKGLGFELQNERQFRGDLIVKYYVNKATMTAYQENI